MYSAPSVSTPRKKETKDVEMEEDRAHAEQL